MLRKVTQKLEKGGGAWLDKIAPKKGTVQNLGGGKEIVINLHVGIVCRYRWSIHLKLLQKMNCTFLNVGRPRGITKK